MNASLGLLIFCCFSGFWRQIYDVICGIDNNEPQVFNREKYETIIAQKDSEIERLKSKIEKLKQENEVMVESFRISSDMLLERLKDLESINFAGERPQTAQVLNRIQGDDGPIKRPKIMDDYEAPQILNFENDKSESIQTKNFQLCTNCDTKILTLDFAKHTVQWIRNSKKCKICQESVPKDNLKKHLLDWRAPRKMIQAIEDDDDEIMLMMHNHGAKAESYLDKKKQQKPLHFIALNCSVRCLLVLMGNGLEELDPVDISGDTPLQISIKGNSTIIAKAMIELGCDIESRDSSQRTPLMNAWLKGNLEVSQKLLEVGSDWKATNALHDSWMTLAQKSGNQDIVMMLANKGAPLRPMSGLSKNRESIGSLKIKKKPVLKEM